MKAMTIPYNLVFEPGNQSKIDENDLETSHLYLIQQYVISQCLQKNLWELKCWDFKAVTADYDIIAGNELIYTATLISIYLSNI